MPPQRHRDGKSRATLCRQGTRLGKRQRAEARELEQMRSHDRVALPALHGARLAPAWITYSSLLGQHQRRERARPLRWSCRSMLVPCGHGRQAIPELRGHMAEPVFCQPGRQSMPGAHCPPAAPALCQPGGWPYMAPYSPPMLPLQCLRPSVEEGPLGRHGQNPFHRPMSQWSRLLVLSRWRVQ